ncbi:DNA adenine methylase [Burkholderia gladioli]|uniref:DNA adenine methylase n=1 Tax=Burkholderia gladioli TaxID=28095 RepID=UPI0016402F54|nr:DNA adenine methylase [Burkholderia gladioli]
MTTSNTDAPIKAPLLSWFGGKFRIAKWIIERLPPHEVYVEPFGGAAGVLLQKPRSPVEIYNDLDGEIVNLFRVVRDEAMRERLIAALEATPYSRAEFEAAWSAVDEPIERARRLCVRAQMGFGATGSARPLDASAGFAADIWTDRLGQWARYPDRLSAIGTRLRGTLIEHKPAAQLIARHDAPGTLFYIDPPYLPGTRASRGVGRDYRHEMTPFEHADLLAMLTNLQGMAVISGYASEMYDASLIGWARFTHMARAQGQRGAVSREEVLWVSPAACVALNIEPGSQHRGPAVTDMTLSLFEGMSGDAADHVGRTAAGGADMRDASLPPSGAG